MLCLAGLEFADAGVLRVIARAAAAIGAAGQPLRIRGASDAVRHHLGRHGVVPPAVLDDVVEGER